MPKGIQKIPVNRNILIWARKEARLTVEQAAERAGIRELKPRGHKEGLSPKERLERWEKGIDTPTILQLKDVAKVYRRPFLTFFLENPPAKDSRISDYRTIGSRYDPANDTPELAAFIRQIEAMQKYLSGILEEMGGKRMAFVGSVSIDEKPIQIVEKIRLVLNFPFDLQKRTRSREILFNVIRDRAESAGIFVLRQGDLGSYHSYHISIDAEAFRGLAISDFYAPLIVVNSYDTKAAQVFTIIHELAHIFLGDTVISNFNAFRIQGETQKNPELFCNQIAAEFLTPEIEILIDWESQKYKGNEEAIKRLSQRYKISEVVVALRLLRFGLIDRECYQSILTQCIAQWQLQKEKIKKRAKESEGCIPYERLTKNRLGIRMIDTIIGAARRGIISELDASQLLKVKINKFGDLFSSQA